LFLTQPDVTLVRNTSNQYTTIANPWYETLPVVEFSNVTGDIHCQFNRGSNNDPANLFHITGITRSKVIVDAKARTVTDQDGLSVLSAFNGVFPRIWGNDPGDGTTNVETRVYTTMAASVSAKVIWEQEKL
jgi:hypothetical protein